jgi:hypothetical protein
MVELSGPMSEIFAQIPPMASRLRDVEQSPDGGSTALAKWLSGVIASVAQQVR